MGDEDNDGGLELENFSDFFGDDVDGMLLAIGPPAIAAGGPITTTSTNVVKAFSMWDHSIVTIQFPDASIGWHYLGSTPTKQEWSRPPHDVLRLIARKLTCTSDPYQQNTCRTCKNKSSWRRRCETPTNLFYIYANTSDPHILSTHMSPIVLHSEALLPEQINYFLRCEPKERRASPGASTISPVSQFSASPVPPPLLAAGSGSSSSSHPGPLPLPLPLPSPLPPLQLPNAASAWPPSPTTAISPHEAVTECFTYASVLAGGETILPLPVVDLINVSTLDTDSPSVFADPAFSRRFHAIAGQTPCLCFSIRGSIRLHLWAAVAAHAIQHDGADQLQIAFHQPVSRTAFELAVDPLGFTPSDTDASGTITTRPSLATFGTGVDVLAVMVVIGGASQPELRSFIPLAVVSLV